MGTIIRSSVDSKNHYNEISMQSEQELLHILAEADDVNRRVEIIQRTFTDILKPLLNIIK